MTVIAFAILAHSVPFWFIAAALVTMAESVRRKN
jgi:hypothetical protein